MGTAPDSTVRLAVEAMACRWELHLAGGDAVRLRAAGEAALGEVTRLEALLSPFRPDSPVAQINAQAAARPVRVPAELFEALWRCRELGAFTGGAFDLTVGPLLAAWGFRGGPPGDPATARELVGWERLSLDREARTVAFDGPGMALDFGAAGKGLAAAAAIAALREVGVRRALLSGGGSTVAALGELPYPIGLPDPAAPGQLLERIHLRNACLSVSTRCGRTVQVGERLVSHVIDPRTGEPADGPALAAVVAPDGLLAEALSTALLVDVEALLRAIPERFAGVAALCAWAAEPPREPLRCGPWPAAR